MKMVKITWMDAQRIELGVQQLEEIKEIEPIPCDILGFLVHETKDKIIIAQEKWDNLAGFKYIHIIPKISILKVKEVK